MSSPIAEAFVRITADLKGFRTGLNAKLKAELATPFPAATVVVRPLTTGFRASLLEQIKLATKGLVIEVPVVPVAIAATTAVAAGAAGAGATSTGTAAAASSALAASTDAVTASESKARASKISLISVQEKLAVLESRAAAISKIDAAALDDQAAAQANLKAAISASEQAIALFVRAEATEDAALIETAGALKIKLADLVAVREEEQKSALAAKQAATTASAANRTQKATTKELADVQALSTKQAQQLLLIQRREGIDTTNLSSVKKGLADANRLVKSTADLATRALLTEDAAVRLSTKNNAELAISLREQLAATVATTKATVEKAAADKLATAQADRRAAAQTAEAKTVVRGAAATGLAASGLRGATLAASGPFLAGAAGVTVLLKSVEAASAFQKQLFILKDVSGATAAQMKILSAEAIQLGSDLKLPAVSANDAATALTDLVTSGFSLKESQAAVRGALLLSVAAQISAAQATDITARTLDAFNLKGEDSIRVVNVLANAATSGEGSVTDFAAGLQQIGAVAARSGLSLENTTALLQVFAKGGFTGAQAGTALRQALLRLENPTKNANDILKSLNVQLRDAQGNIRPDFLVKFAEATDGLSKSLRDSLVAATFGARAVRGFDIAAAQGAQGLTAAQQAQERNNTAQKLAEAQTEGLSGHLKELGKNANTLGVQFGSGLTPAFTGLTDIAGKALKGLGDTTKIIAQLVSPLRHLSGVVKDVTGAFGVGLFPVLAVVGAYKAYGAISNVVIAAQKRLIVSSAGVDAAMAALTAATTEAEVAEAALAVETATAEAAASGFAALLGPIGLAVTAAVGLGVGIELLGRRESATKKATDELAASARNLSTAFNATNLVTERKALEDLATATLAAGKASATQVVGFSPRGGGHLVTDDQKAAADATSNFVKQLRAQADAIKDIDPLLAHNRNLLADYVAALHTVPNKIETKIFADNKQTKTSLQEVISLLTQVNPAESERAFEAGKSLLNSTRAGFRDAAATPDSFKIPPTTFAGLKSALELSLKTINLSGAAGDQAIADTKDLIERIAATGTRGTTLLRQVGEQLGKALADGLTSTQKDQIAAANQAVSDAITAGQQQIQDSINSSKTNLGSIAQSLAGSVGQIIDTQLQKINDALDHPGTTTFEKLRSQITLTHDSLQKMFVLSGSNPGLIEGGNLDLLHRKVARIGNDIATVKSASIGTDLGETLIPQVIDGKIVSLQKAIEHFRKTGENLGTFATVADANAYAERLHKQQAVFYLSGQELGKSLTSGFLSHVQKAFDLSSEINTLQNQLDKVSQHEQRAQLIAAVGAATDTASRRDAIFQLTQFDLQSRITTDTKKLASEKDNITKTANAQKDAITKNLAAYADEFTKGQISINKFSTLVLNTLKNQKIDFKKTGGSLGNALGEAFFSAAQAQEDAFFKQAGLLVGSTGGSGTTQVSTNDPNATAKAVARSIADAEKNRKAVLDGITGKNGTNKILKDILAAIKPPPTTKPNPAPGSEGGRRTGRRGLVVKS